MMIIMSKDWIVDLHLSSLCLEDCGWINVLKKSHLKSLALGQSIDVTDIGVSRCQLCSSVAIRIHRFQSTRKIFWREVMKVS